MTVAHKDEICAAKYSFHLSLVATASDGGEIAIWDYESSILQSYLRGHKEPVTCLEFLEPRPLLLSCGVDGKVCIWTVRPALNIARYVCIYQFLNKTMHTDSTDIKTAIISCCIVKDEESDEELKISDSEDENIETPKKVRDSLRVVKGYRVNGIDIIKAETYREYKANLVLSQFERKIVYDDDK